MKKYQKAVDEWFQKMGWKYWHPLAQLARLTEETGEVARVVNHLFGEKPKKDSERFQELGAELADVIYTCICIANSQGIDLDPEIKKSIEKGPTRDKDRF